MGKLGNTIHLITVSWFFSIFQFARYAYYIHNSCKLWISPIFLFVWTTDCIGLITHFSFVHMYIVIPVLFVFLATFLSLPFSVLYFLPNTSPYIVCILSLGLRHYTLFLQENFLLDIQNLSAAWFHHNLYSPSGAVVRSSPFPTLKTAVAPLWLKSTIKLNVANKAAWVSSRRASH